MAITDEELRALAATIAWFREISQWAAEREQAYIASIRLSIKEGFGAFWRKVEADKERGGQGGAA